MTNGCLQAWLSCSAGFSAAVKAVLVTAGPAVSSQGLAGNGAAHGHRGCHLAAVTAFVCHEWAIKIVPSLVCTCSNVLAYGLLNPLLVILLLLLTHRFHGVKTNCSMPRSKRDVLRPRPHIAPPFLCPSGCAATKLVAGLNTSRLLRGEVGAVLCQWKSIICSYVPSGRAAPQVGAGLPPFAGAGSRNLFCLL